MYAIVRGGTPQLVSGRFVGNDGRQYMPLVFTAFSAAELAAIDVYPVIDDPIPGGKQAVGWSLEFTGSQVLRRWALADIPPDPVPEGVTRYQFKAALLASNRYQDAMTAINSATNEQKLRWADAQTVRRNSGLVTYLQSALSLTNNQVDTFFRNAAAIGE
jgi:hypothetical protein